MSYAKTLIIGNLGRDPELRYTPAGDAVCSFTVAVNKRKGDETTTLWWKVTCWRKMAENASKYLTKGRGVYVEGRPDVEMWTDRDGNARCTLTLDATDLQFIGGRNEDEIVI